MKSWRESKEYHYWQKSVLLRDGHCRICQESKGELEAHHINHASYFPEERFVVGNGITLCDKCHSVYHTKFHRSTKCKCTRLDFQQFFGIAEIFYIKMGRVGLEKFFRFLPISQMVERKVERNEIPVQEKKESGTVHLCHSCRNSFPTCKGKRLHGERIAIHPR